MHTITPSQINPLPNYFDKYILLAENLPIANNFQISLTELLRVPIKEWMQIGNRIYAENKWTIADILQHIIDCERIFCYRALCFSREEKAAMLSFDEDEYATKAKASERKLQDLIYELETVRKSTISLFGSFSDKMLQQEGKSFTGSYSVASIAFIIIGHQRWHFRVIQERYMPLLST
jgi:hypothetical protein